MEGLTEILKTIKTKASAEAALITSGDGLVLEAVNDADIDLESVAAYAASQIMMSERMGESARCGAPESVIVIYQGKSLVMAPLGPVVAVLVGSGDAKLGNLLLQLRRGIGDLSAALEEQIEAAPTITPLASPGDPEPNGHRPVAVSLPESSISLR